MIYKDIQNINLFSVDQMIDNTNERKEYEGIIINVPVGPLPPSRAYWPGHMALSRLPLASLAETAML